MDLGNGVAIVVEEVIIEKMRRVRKGVPLEPIDWIILSTRVVFLTALPIIAGIEQKLSREKVILLSAWVGITLLISLIRGGGWKPAWLEAATAILETGFAVVVITISGGLSSPIWWILLAGALRAGLAYGLGAMIGVTLLGLAGSAVISVIISDTGYLTLISVGLHTGVLLLAAFVLGLPVEKVRQKARIAGHKGWGQFYPMGEHERDQTRTIFLMAAELNATLDYNRVLDIALDLSARALTDSGLGDTELVSALLLLSNGRLQVETARRLTPKDRREILHGGKGALGQVLTTGDPLLIRNVAKDPELKRLTAMRRCRTVLCIPMITDLEAYGVLLYAHPDRHYFNTERVDLLGAIAQQTVVALHNARLYQDLEQEKERITEIQEETRKKMARDLHDGPTQTIAAIAMRANFARRQIERDPENAIDELIKVEDIARSTTKEIRHMLFTLRPLILESKGLVAALEQLIEKLRETHRQNVTIESDPDVAESMDMGKQGVVFYIAEEAINNARKHAEAEHIWVRLKHYSELFILEVEDNGVGFNVGSVDANYEQRGSLGMVNMRERSELVNGELHIKSEEGMGTCITLIVPLTEESIETVYRPDFAY